MDREWIFFFGFILLCFLLWCIVFDVLSFLIWSEAIVSSSVHCCLQTERFFVSFLWFFVLKVFLGVIERTACFELLEIWLVFPYDLVSTRLYSLLAHVIRSKPTSTKLKEITGEYLLLSSGLFSTTISEATESNYARNVGSDKTELNLQEHSKWRNWTYFLHHLLYFPQKLVRDYRKH